jgi:thioredoxin-related protein
MRTPHILRATLLALATITTSFAGGEGWTHDWEAAKKQAATENKDLLLDFTGSDWCGWCIKLDKEVFQKEGFKNAAKEKFILVEVDFPNDTSKISQETQDQNKKLAEQFAVEGYPTILLCDASGKPYAAAGYEEGGDQKYIALLDGLRAKKTKRDNGLAAAAKLEGTAKAKALVEVLADIPEELIPGSYANVIEEIKKADPKDESGFLKKQTMQAKLQEFSNGLQPFAEKEDHKGALAYTDKALKDGGFEGEMKQQVTCTRAMILAEMKQFDEAIKTLDEAKAIAPDSETAKEIDEQKTEISGMKKEGEKPKDAPADDTKTGDTAKPAAPAEDKAAK